MQGVWSDEDDCIASLSVDLDNMISPQLPLGNVLDRVATCLGKAQREKGSSGDGGRGKGTEEEEEEMEGEGDGGSDMDDDDDDDDDNDDDDGYYGDDIDADVMDDQPSHSRYPVP